MKAVPHQRFRSPQRGGGGGGKRAGPGPQHRQSHVRHRPQRNGANSPGDARRHYERYMALARDAAASGDHIEMENCYQHAEHYFRVMRQQAD